MVKFFNVFRINYSWYWKQQRVLLCDTDRANFFYITVRVNPLDRTRERISESI